MDLIFRSFGSTPEVSVGRKNFFAKRTTRNFGFQKHEISVRKPDVLARNPEVSGKTRNFRKSCLPECFGSGNPKF
jgi:hypothetical protein